MAQEALVHALVPVLYGTLDANPEVRTTAEAHLAQGAAQPGFGVALARVTLTPELPYGIRQLAGVLLKRYVNQHWQEGEEGFVPPAVSDVDKAAIRALLPSGLGDSIAKLRTAVGMAIAAVARWDWPQDWPDLMALLVAGVRQRDSLDLMHGALRCLSLVAEHLDDSAMPQAVPVLWPELAAIVADRAAPAVAARQMPRRALAVMHACLATLADMRGTYRQQINGLLGPSLPAWASLCGAVLAEPAVGAGAWALKLEALRAATLIAQAFPALLAPHLPTLLGPCWGLLSGCGEMYEAMVVRAEGDDAEVDSDGEELSFETFVAQLLEFVLTLLGSPKFRAHLRPALAPLADVLMGYMQMTASQERCWAEDPNEFVADEDDDTCSVRAACEIALSEMCTAFGAEALEAVGAAAGARMAASAAARRAGETRWWKRREAALLALGGLHETLLEAAGAGRCPVNLTALVEDVMREDLGRGGEPSASAAGAAGGSSPPAGAGPLPPAPPFLRARALWAAARLAPPAAHAAAALAAAADLSPGAPPSAAATIVRIGACRALAALVPRLPAASDALRCVLAPVYQGLAPLLNEAKEETLHLVLEALSAAISADPGAASSAAPALCPSLLQVWAAHVTDPLIGEDAAEALYALAAVPGCLDGVLAAAVPALAAALAAPASQPAMLVEAALDLLAGLLHRASRPAAREVHRAVFGSAAALAAAADDGAVRHNAARCLAALVRAGGDEILQWGPGAPAEVLSTLVGVATRLVAPDADEPAARAAWPLIQQLAAALPGQLAAGAGLLVSGLAARLAGTPEPSPMLSVSLVLVFARLTHCWGAAQMLECLSATALPSGAPALPAVLTAWAERQPDVHGTFNIKLTTTALAALLATGHPQLTSTQVRGRLLPAAGGGPGGIMTRARARAAGPERWTAVPVGAKILGLLADAVLEARRTAEEDEADEWEDDSGSDEDENADEPASSSRGENAAGSANGAGDGRDAAGVKAESAGSPGGFAAGLAAAFGASGDDEGDGGDDEDAGDSAIAQLDLEAYLRECLRGLARSESIVLASYSADLMAPQRGALEGLAAGGP